MIVIVGATGNTGSALAKELVKNKVPFRTIARDTARAKAALGPEVEVVPGDLDQPATLAPALRGASRLFFAVGRTPNLVENEKALVDQAKAAGVGHVVKLSGFEVSPEGPAMVQMAHDAVERHLRASGLPHTILGGNFFFQNFLGLAPAIAKGALPVPTGDGKAALVDTRDIARAAAVVLTTDGHAGKRYVLTGSEALSHGDAARIFSEVLGRPVAHVDLPQADFTEALLGAGLPDWFAPLLSDVYVKLYKSGLAGKVSGDFEHLTGEKPTSLAAFIRDHQAAFAAA